MTTRRGRGTTAERLIEVETRLETIVSKLSEIAADLKAASESRKKVYDNQESLSKQMVGLDWRIQTLEKEVAAFAPTSREYERFRERAIGAGTLGRWLWRLGGLLISAAAGAAAAWTTLTGRPPP